MSLNIHLEKFEGPLGLLLYLIRRDEMDIFDINIQKITTQYLEYIKAMKNLNLEVAGEFVAMAATLIHIKSKMLLPSHNENPETGEEEGHDPRSVLVQKLLEYQKFQEASRLLVERPLLGRDVFLRSLCTLPGEQVIEEIVVEENPLFSLIRAYRWAIRNMKSQTHRVLTELQSIAERIREFKKQLVVGERVKFETLLDKRYMRENEGLVGHVLITFLSLLELGKMGFTQLFQSGPCTDIYVFSKMAIGDDIIERAKDFEAGYSYGADPFASNRGSQQVLPLEGEGVSSPLVDEPAGVPSHSVGEIEVINSPRVSESDISGFGDEAATDEEIEEEEKRLDLI